MEGARLWRAGKQGDKSPVRSDMSEHEPLAAPPSSPPPHYHNCVQNMRGRGSDHVILFTPCLALFTNDMPLTAERTGARRHLLIRAVGADQRRVAGNGYPVTNQISGRTESRPHLPGLH